MGSRGPSFAGSVLVYAYSLCLTELLCFLYQGGNLKDNQQSAVHLFLTLLFSDDITATAHATA